MIRFLSFLFETIWFFFFLGTLGRAKPRRCPTCKSRLLSETGQGYTRSEAVGLGGADIMVHYREYRCTECGDHCHFRGN